MVGEGLEGGEVVKEKGIDGGVMDMYWMKGIDEERVVGYGEKRNGIVRGEKDNVIGGLGSGVGEVVSEDYGAGVKRMGVDEGLGEVGRMDYLKKS